MKKEEKEKMLEKLQADLARVHGKIERAIEREKVQSRKPMSEVKQMMAEEKMSYFFLQSVGERRIQELELLLASPFFMRCELELEEKKVSGTFSAHLPNGQVERPLGPVEKRYLTPFSPAKQLNLYIGKFGFFEEQIYSWVAPIATIRFEAPGRVSYITPKGEVRHALMRTKEQFMIVDGKILFYAMEELGKPRELIHQEHFARKQGFVLPEIVAQMEAAQDAVIRAHHVGPFVISGPAGSGKTTLALHRVAYLAQAPDTAELYPGHKSIVFVQDTGTKEYFAHLLPELGITNVAITTFAEWAMKVLDIPLRVSARSGFSYAPRYGESELEQDRYEAAKMRALREGKLPKFPARKSASGEEEVVANYYKLLATHYGHHFDEATARLWSEQRGEQVFDRFDLTLLLRALLATKKKFVMEYEYYHSQHGRPIKLKKEKREIGYNLVVVDEFQNYLPEQLAILQRTVEPERRTMLYVGDLGQQVQLGTVQGWEEVGETIHSDRRVVLEKVYRNTKHILEYIRGLGYQVEIPESLRAGTPVREERTDSPEEEIAYVRALLQEGSDGLIGVLAKDVAYLETFRAAFADNPKIKVSTMAEAQGVEFEKVVLVGIRPGLFSTAYARELGPAFEAAKSRIYRDLLYVALTRAMNELHILGRSSLASAMPHGSMD